MNLVEIGHRAVTVRDVAQFADRRDVAVHRIDRFEAHQLRPLARQGGQAALQILGVVMAENLLLGAAVADARDHRGVVQRVRQYDDAGDFLRQGRQRRLVRDIARSKDQRRLAPVQIGQLAFEFEMQMPVAGDVARAAGAGPERLDRPGHRRQHVRVLAHAEIIVRAPHRDLGPDAVIVSPREAAAAPLEVGEDAVSPLGAERVEALFEKSVVVHVSAPLEESTG